MSTRTRFEKEVKGNSEMVYWIPVDSAVISLRTQWVQIYLGTNLAAPCKIFAFSQWGVISNRIGSFEKIRFESLDFPVLFEVR